jgi:predicted RNase H-like HicB family nuclease
MTKYTKTIYRFPVVIEKDESGYFLGKVPSLKSCYTQAKTLSELYKRLKEVVALCLEVEEKHFGRGIEQNKFIGVQELEFSRPAK